jgi:hypothetical protein
MSKAVLSSRLAIHKILFIFTRKTGIEILFNSLKIEPIFNKEKMHL